MYYYIWFPSADGATSDLMKFKWPTACVNMQHGSYRGFMILATVFTLFDRSANLLNSIFLWNTRDVFGENREKGQVTIVV